MQHISLPKKFIVEETEKGKKSRVIIEPCFPGYGLTLGNALRRVLLSSLPGGAITAVKIKGAPHEFTTLPHISEDLVEVILNLKKLRIKVHTDEPLTLKIKVKGEKKVTGADIEPSAEAEIINRDLLIATLNNPAAELEMDLTVAKGIGYVPVEEQDKSNGEIGLIFVDSIFTPVVNVGLSVEPTRVGRRTDYDRLILDIETDGTINAEQAVQKAAEILTNQFNWLMEGGRVELSPIDVEKPVVLPEKPDLKEVLSEEKPLTEEGMIESVSSEASLPEKEKEDEIEQPKKKRGRPKKSEK